MRKEKHNFGDYVFQFNFQSNGTTIIFSFPLENDYLFFVLFRIPQVFPVDSLTHYSPTSSYSYEHLLSPFFTLNSLVTLNVFLKQTDIDDTILRHLGFIFSSFTHKLHSLKLITIVNTTINSHFVLVSLSLSHQQPPINLLNSHWSPTFYSQRQ